MYGRVVLWNIRFDSTHNISVAILVPFSKHIHSKLSCQVMKSSATNLCTPKHSDLETGFVASEI